MKSFWKVSFAGIGLLTGIGLVSIALGGVFGGWESAGHILQQKFRGITGYSAEGSSSYENMEIARFDAVSSIQMEIDQCEAVITGTEEDFYGVSAENIKTLQCYMDGNMLVIETDDERHSSNARLTLYIPADAVPDIVEIEIGGGVLTAEGIRADIFCLQAGAGVFRMNGLQADSVEIEVGAGSMEITNGDVTDMVIETGMGEFSWQGSIRGDLEAECGMGTINMAVQGVPEDFNYDTEGMMGDIIIGDIDASRLLFDNVLDNGADKNIELTCGMGAIEITFYENGGNENG